GVVEGANDTTAIGQEDGWRAVDNGPPEGGVPDQLSLAAPLTAAGLGTAQNFCASTPLNGDLALRNLIGGDMAVNASGPPPPPTPTGPACGHSRAAPWLTPTQPGHPTASASPSIAMAGSLS